MLSSKRVWEGFCVLVLTPYLHRNRLKKCGFDHIFDKTRFDTSTKTEGVPPFFWPPKSFVGSGRSLSTCETRPETYFKKIQRSASRIVQLMTSWSKVENPLQRLTSPNRVEFVFFLEFLSGRDRNHIKTWWIWSDLGNVYFYDLTRGNDRN